MAYLTRLANIFSKRSDVETSQPADDDDRWYSPFITQSSTGAHVTPESAIGTSAVYACVAAIAQTIGIIPLLTYERLASGDRLRATESPYYYLFAVSPNDWMTTSEWKEITLVHLCLRGNSFQFKLRDRSGRIVAIIPLNPCNMEVQQMDDYSLNYKYTTRKGETFNFSTREIMHFRFGISDGLVGRSPISVARDPIGLAISQEAYSGKFFKNSAKPSGVLTHPAKLNKESADRIRESWQRAHGGEDQAWKVAVLEEGMKFDPITMTSADAQFIEQRRFQLEEVARIFRVPPHIVGDLSRATFSNIEHQAISFLQNCLSPYITRLEQTLIMNFFSYPVNGKSLYVEFLVDALLRADTKTRDESNEIRRRNGVLSANEWRRMENMTAITDGTGDKYIIPQNMIWSDLLGEAQTNKKPDNNLLTDGNDDDADTGTDDEEEIDEEEDDEMIEEVKTSIADGRELARRAFAVNLERLIYKETEAVNRIAKKEDSETRLDEFFAQHESLCRTALESEMKLYSYTVSMLQRKPFVEDNIRNVWNGFWSSYRASVGKKQATRVIDLANAICSGIETQVGNIVLI